MHEEFSPKVVDSVRKNYPKAKILAHLECMPSVIEKVDMAGGTEGMIKYLGKSSAKDFMLVTECGLSDRMKVEYPEKHIVGTCVLCPYMKEVMLKDVLQALKKPRRDQVIRIPKLVRERAKKALDKMVRITEKRR